ncbi:MAG TPA: DoxX family protein [Gemmatimonadaceae bacterium]|nr:DoxX family protein [Gemmatimonadaceae bacterium]
MTQTSLTARWRSAAPHFQSILRIVAAFAFFTYGTSKLFGWPAAMLPNGATAVLASKIGFAGILETVGGALLFIGLFTRPVAFLLCGEMAYAYLTSHMVRSFWPTVSQGTPALLFCFIWLYISAAGPGPWSIDAMRWRSDDR